MTGQVWLFEPVPCSGAPSGLENYKPRAPPVVLPEPSEVLGSGSLPFTTFQALQFQLRGFFVARPGPSLGQDHQLERTLFSVIEAAEALSLSRATIYKLIASQRLRQIKIGRASRIPLAEIERFLRELAIEQYDDASLVVRQQEVRK